MYETKTAKHLNPQYKTDDQVSHNHISPCFNGDDTGQAWTQQCVACIFIPHSLTHSLTHSLIHSLTHLPPNQTLSLNGQKHETHPPTQTQPTQSPTKIHNDTHMDNFPAWVDTRVLTGISQALLPRGHFSIRRMHS